MSIMRRLPIRTGCSITALIVPIVHVTYPSGLSDHLGGGILLMYTFPGSLINSFDDLSELSIVLAAIAMVIVLVSAPALPLILEPLSRRIVNKPAISVCNAVLSIITLFATMSMSVILHNSPFHVTGTYFLLHSVVILTFALDIAVLCKYSAEQIANGSNI